MQLSDRFQHIKFGYLPDPLDFRDQYYKVAPRVLKELPPSVNLADQCAPILDQKNLGSCVANASASVHQFAQKAQQEPDFGPSRLFIYWNARRLMGVAYTKIDSGTYIRNGIKTLAKDGACPETQWPYVVRKFRDKPPRPCYKEAEKHQGIVYNRVEQDLSALKGVLSEGRPIIFGFTVYESFMTDSVAKSGIVPMPKTSEKVLGGHAIYLSGYDDGKERFRFRNSWSEGWGQDGEGEMPYEYIANPDLATDFWVLDTVE